MEYGCWRADLCLTFDRPAADHQRFTASLHGLGLLSYCWIMKEVCGFGGTPRRGFSATALHAVCRLTHCKTSGVSLRSNFILTHNLYNPEIFLYKLWRPKGFFQLGIIINVSVSTFCFIWIRMVRVYGHCTLLIVTAWGSTLDVRIWRLSTSDSDV